jgi:hypothetical protein
MIPPEKIRQHSEKDDQSGESANDAQATSHHLNAQPYQTVRGSPIVCGCRDHDKQKQSRTPGRSKPE